MSRYTNNKQIQVYLDEPTARKISLLAKINSSSSAHTISLLVNTAFKHNYTPDLRYIPCNPQYDIPPVSISDSYHHAHRSHKFAIDIILSKANTAKINKLIELYSFSSPSEAVRSLVETALLYDYDINLFFHHPQPISISNQNILGSNKKRDTIFLDFI